MSLHCASGICNHLVYTWKCCVQKLRMSLCVIHRYYNTEMVGVFSPTCEVCAQLTKKLFVGINLETALMVQICTEVRFSNPHPHG